jgi:tetratricopeptide (TPR) repeat protein
VEYITLLNQSGQWRRALEHLSHRRFSPWEGGERLVSAQYVYAHRSLGREDLEAGNAKAALKHFEAARHYPENLGEGKHLLTLERDLDYFSGMAAEQLGDAESAHRYWSAAAAPLPSPGIHSYFQAQALKALGNPKAASQVLSRLAEFAEERANAEPKLDYFATSLPNLLLFDDDLAKRNQIEAHLLKALAGLESEDTGSAVALLQKVVAEDPNHLFAAETLHGITRAATTACGQPEVNLAS